MYLNFIRFFTLIMLANTTYGGFLELNDYYNFFKECSLQEGQPLSKESEEKINTMASNLYEANKFKTYDQQYTKIDEYREGIEKSLRKYYQNKSRVEELELHLTVLEAAFQKLKRALFSLYTIDE